MDIWILMYDNTFFEDTYVVGVCETKEMAKELLGKQGVTLEWKADRGIEFARQDGTDRLWRVVKYTLNNLDVSVIRRGMPV